MRNQLTVVCENIPRDLAERHNVDAEKAQVVYIRQGNFTVAMLLNANNKPVSIGVAKRNITDSDDKQIGHRIAVSRALRNIRVLHNMNGEDTCEYI